ncbi:MAG: hypothetical protein J6K58_04835 [Lachnospiraceae bacterium]|nr:hypothetical protein [Lachnospiraceae bacterium]
MNIYSKWKRLGLNSFVTALSNGAFRRYCDSSVEVWKHKVRENCYRVTISNNVDDVILDNATWGEVIECLEEE